MIIVAEGTDGVGKTTLLDAIQDRWYDEVVRLNHGPPEDDDPALSYFDTVTDMVRHSRNGSLVLCDRFHVGELVYGPLLRDGSKLTIDEARVIDMVLSGAGATMLHCTLPSPLLKMRLLARDNGRSDEKSGAALEHAYALKALFRALIGQEVGSLPGPWQDRIMDGYPDQMATSITIGAKIRAELAHKGSGLWIGDPLADVVLALPSSECANVSHLSWMVSNLSEMGLLDQTAVVTEGTSKPTLGDRVTIALGKRACEWLDLAGWPWYDTVAHKVDQQFYDDSHVRWMASLEAAVESGRTAIRGSG